jgi:hypothetical protein
VDLDYAQPPIWRRLDVASDLSLDELHRVIQAAFGWAGQHLHEFVAGTDRWDGERFVHQDMIDNGDASPESAVIVEELMNAVGDRLSYTYDFGDSWDHSIRLEAMSDREPGQPRAALVGGKRHCPPEDCGGIPGYLELIDAVSDPAHPDHAELSEWLKDVLGLEDIDDFDPGLFDLENLSADVRRAVR